MYRDHESYLAATRVPTYNESLFSLPPTCKTPEDYRDLRGALYDVQFSGKRTVVAREAKRQCPDFCTRIWYKVDVSSELRPFFYEAPLLDNQAPAAILGHKELEWNWKIALVSRSVTTMTQYFSYDLSQLIAELGGSWGLFLGASFLTIFDVIDRALARAAPMIPNLN
jgi:hypothetical protein